VNSNTRNFGFRGLWQRLGRLAILATTVLLGSGAVQADEWFCKWDTETRNDRLIILAKNIVLVEAGAITFTMPCNRDVGATLYCGANRVQDADTPETELMIIYFDDLTGTPTSADFITLDGGSLRPHNFTFDDWVCVQPG